MLLSIALDFPGESFEFRIALLSQGNQLIKLLNIAQYKIITGFTALSGLSNGVVCGSDVAQGQVGQPQINQPGLLPGLSGGATTAANTVMPTQIGPQQQALQAQHYAGMAPLQNAFQQARADATLGNTKLGGAANRAGQNYETQLGNSLLYMLRGLV